MLQILAVNKYRYMCFIILFKAKTLTVMYNVRTCFIVPMFIYFLYINTPKNILDAVFQ